MKLLKKLNKKQILKGNIIIATRLGWEEYEEKGIIGFFKQDSNGEQESRGTTSEDLNFHKSFDSLIPVIKMLLSETEGKLQLKTDLTMTLLQLEVIPLFDAVINFIYLTSSKNHG